MIWFAAVTTGFGLGLASFGTLWLAVRHLVRRPERWILIVASHLARLCLVGVALYALVREGPEILLAGVAGLWLARWCLIWRLGGVQYGR